MATATKTRKATATQAPARKAWNLANILRMQAAALDANTEADALHAIWQDSATARVATIRWYVALYWAELSAYVRGNGVTTLEHAGVQWALDRAASERDRNDKTSYCHEAWQHIIDEIERTF